MFLPRWLPHDVVEDVAHVLRRVESGQNGADRVGADLMPSLDELDELVHHGARSDDVCIVPTEREPVAAQRDRALKALAQRVEDAVLHARKLRGHLVRDVQHLLHRRSVGTD